MNTSKCTVSVFTEGGGGYAKTCVTAREGATVEMVADTQRHFIHAVKVLEVGLTHAAESATNRAAYEENTTHEEARVVMWGQAAVLVAPVEISGLTVLAVSINVVTEYTSAQEIIDLTWILLNALGYQAPTDEQRETWNKQQPAQPSHNAPQSHETARYSDLPTSQVSIQAPDENGVIYMGSWDDRKPEYWDMIGKTVSFDVTKITSKISDGVASWSIYPKLSNGRTGDFPMSYVYADGKYNADGVIDILTEVAKPGGKDVEGQYRAIGKIAKRKKKDGSNGLAFYTHAIEKELVF